MTTSQCTSCGRIQHCQCRRQASSSAEDKATDVTPACCCGSYVLFTYLFLFFILMCSGKQFMGKAGCYLELFASSVTVSNLNANTTISTADWRIGLVATSPVTHCNTSFRTSKSRLLRGDHEVVSESAPWPDAFGQLVPSDNTDEPVISLDFKGVAMRGGFVGNLVRGYKVQIAVGVKTDDDGQGSLMVMCGDLPVKFTAEPEGNVIGSLLGNIKRCEYVVGDNLDIPF